MNSKYQGRGGIYQPTPADAGIGYDVNSTCAALCVRDCEDGTVDILVFSNIPEQLGMASPHRGVGVGAEQGQFNPHL